jgi:hypothetical protein
VVHLTHETILRLLFFRKLTSFTDRRVFEVHLSFKPVAPRFPGIDDWIIIMPAGLNQETRYILRVCLFFEVLDEDEVVDVAIVEFISKFLIV